MKKRIVVFGCILFIVLLFSGCIQKPAQSANDAKLFKELSNKISVLLSKESFKLKSVEKLQMLNSGIKAMEPIEARAYFFKNKNNIKILRETPFGNLVLYRWDNNLVVCYTLDGNSSCIKADKEQQKEFDNAINTLFTSADKQILEFLKQKRTDTNTDIKIEDLFFIKKMKTTKINNRECSLFNLKPNYEKLTKILSEDFNELYVDVNTCIDNELGISLITDSVYIGPNFAVKHSVTTSYVPECSREEVVPSAELLKSIG
ncbi:MAG: hypothetical protein J7L14_01375 [Candidatus Diapherotrites archaeon]|nr:hypothetical protein [Candidatus Diapherotrites archaeon]